MPTFEYSQLLFSCAAFACSCGRSLLSFHQTVDGRLAEIEYESLTAAATEVTEDVPPAKKRFGAIPNSKELVVLSQFEVPRNTARSTQWADL